MEKSLILDVIKYAKLILLLFLLLLSFTLFSQNLPAERSVDWTKSGLIDKAINVEQVINVKDFGAIGDGLADEFSAVNAVIDYFAGSPGVVFFPPGNYLFKSPISLPSNIILRGASSDSSFLFFDFYECNSQSCISASGKESRSDEQSVLNETEIDAFSVEIQDVSDFFPGDFIEIYQENGEWDIKPADWAQDAVGQIVQVNSIIGNQLIFNDKLRFAYDLALNPKIKKIKPVENVGIEFLNIRRYECEAGATGYNILFNMAVNCWVRGVESAKSYQSHVMINSSSNIEISGSFFHDAFKYDGSNTQGYGVTLNRHSSQCLIQDNIFEHLRHAMILKNGANGNVIAYNYSSDPFRSEIPTNASGDINLHGHYAYANLIEGNIVQNIVIDHYWGPSGPLNTFLRNRTELYGFIMTSSTYETKSQNFVGNETYNSLPICGNFILTGSNHYSYGNNIKGVITPNNTNQLSDLSYYLDNTPLFWTISDLWPSIGLPNELNAGSIPAKERFLRGIHLTVYPEWTDTFSTMGITETIGGNIVLVYPIPCNEKLIIKGGSCDHYSIYTIQGECVIKGLSIKDEETRLNTESLKAGAYILRLQSETHTQNVSFMKTD